MDRIIVKVKWFSREKNLEGYRLYNATKQREYRAKRPKNPYPRAERVFHAEGHCKACGMLLKSEWHTGDTQLRCIAILAVKEHQEEACSFCGLSLASEYHKKHLLVGCMKAMKIHAKRSDKGQ